MRISFCTTCHNRAYQLKQVFMRNRAAILASPDLQWVILNYHSGDDLHEYLAPRWRHCHGRILYAREVSNRPWHVSLAKNIAHRLATGDILVNLDCDNLIANAVSLVRTGMQEGVGGLHMISARGKDGTFGRIAVRRDLFHAAGGYEECFYPMGYQDKDLLFRLRAMGQRIDILHSPSGVTVWNTRKQSIANCRIGSMTWRQFRDANEVLSKANLAAGRLVANTGREWGVGQLEL